MNKYTKTQDFLLEKSKEFSSYIYSDEQLLEFLQSLDAQQLELCCFLMVLNNFNWSTDLFLEPTKQ